MAYGFEQKQAKIDSDVKAYLDENMHFEAWTMIIRHFDGKTSDEWDDLYEQLEKECYKKTTKLTDEDQETLQAEYTYYRNEARQEFENHGGILNSNPTTIQMEA